MAVYLEETYMLNIIEAKESFTNVNAANEYWYKSKVTDTYQYTFTFNINDKYRPLHDIIKDFRCNYPLKVKINNVTMNVDENFVLPIFLMQYVSHDLYVEEPHDDPVMITATFIILSEEERNYYKVPNRIVISGNLFIVNGSAVDKRTMLQKTYV